MLVDGAVRRPVRQRHKENAKMKLENATLTANGKGNAVLVWTDDYCEYQVFCFGNGNFSQWVGRINKADVNRENGEQRKLPSINLNRWRNRDLRAAVAAILTPERILEVIAAATADVEAKEAADRHNARIHRLRDAVQAIIGASADELAEALVKADPAIAAAATLLREAGQ